MGLVLFDVGFFWGFTFVEFEEAGVDFVGPAETPGLFLLGLFPRSRVSNVVFLFVAEQELTTAAPLHPSNR